MIQDAKLVFSDAQSVINSIATLASTNVVNWGKANPNAGYGHPLWLTVTVATSLSGLTSAATFQVKAQHASDGSTWVTLLMTSAWPVDGTGAIAAGTQFINHPIPGVLTQYMRLVYICAGASILSGTIDGYLHLGGMP